MELAKYSQMIKSAEDKEKLLEYLSQLDGDVRSIITMSQGRVRFGDGADGEIGENVSGEFQVISDTGAINTEFTVAHTLGAVPIGYIVTKISKAGIIYDSGTTWTSSNLYLKCSVANAAVSLFLLK
jgi:hypothetical protein